MMKIYLKIYLILSISYVSCLLVQVLTFETKANPNVGNITGHVDSENLINGYFYPYKDIPNLKVNYCLHKNFEYFQCKKTIFCESIEIVFQ